MAWSGRADMQISSEFMVLSPGKLSRRHGRPSGYTIFRCRALRSRHEAIRLPRVRAKPRLKRRLPCRDLVAGRLPVHILQEAAHRVDLLAEACPIPGLQLLPSLVVANERLLRPLVRRART